jgi:hypothetical protein
MRWLDAPEPDSSREAGRQAVGVLASSLAMVVILLAFAAIAIQQLGGGLDVFLAVAGVVLLSGFHGVVRAYDLRRDYRLLKRKGR